MQLEATVSDIARKLREGNFPKRQSIYHIYQGIVLRILSDLSWEVHDTNMVSPEYRTGEGRIGCALCHPPTAVKILIEVKQPGGRRRVRQTLEYAFHARIQLVVSTDGRTWSFRLPTAPTAEYDYDEQGIFRLDLTESPASESAAVLQRYLEQGRVASGEVLRTVREEHESFVARRTIPRAWRELVESRDELLFDLIAETVESKVGFQPAVEDIAGFLADSSGTGLVADSSHPPLKSPPQNSASQRRDVLVVKGRKFSYKSAKEAMVIVLRELAQADTDFLQRCSSHPAFLGSKRRYLARRTEDIFPDRPGLRKLHERLPGGWLVSTNENNSLKMKLIKAAAQVAGLRFGHDVIVEF